MSPQRPKRPCRYPFCPSLCSDGSGYCPDHLKPAKQQREQFRGSAASRGYDAAHRKLRAEVLREAIYLCQRCLSMGRVTPATDMHHLFKVATHPHLRLVKSNCVACCRECHEAMEKESV